MFLFSKKYKLDDTEFFSNFSDHHSHILPGVDDGVQSVEEALKILHWYEELGVKRVTFTPHIMEDYPNNAQSLRLVFAKFQEQYHGSIELNLAAEYMLDSKFNNHLDSDDLLIMGDNYLLVESSYVSAPIYFFETLSRIASKGYFVVLAHPERYLFLQDVDYERLKDMRILFQLNLMSIYGGYGESVMKRTKRLLDSGYYDIVGSDIHRLSFHQRILNSSKLSSRYSKIINDLALRVL